MLRKLYVKSLEIASSKKSISFLGFISFIESFIFPIPPDVMIIPMTIANKKNWLRIATVATIGSVCGAIVGYIIGYVFFNEIGLKIFELYGVDNVSFLKDKVSSEGGIIAWCATRSCGPLNREHQEGRHDVVYCLVKGGEHVRGHFEGLVGRHGRGLRL